jgi:hypothetical protein
LFYLDKNRILSNISWIFFGFFALLFSIQAMKFKTNKSGLDIDFSMKNIFSGFSADNLETSFDQNIKSFERLVNNSFINTNEKLDIFSVSFNEKLDIVTESQQQLNISFNEKLDIFSVSFNEKLDIVTESQKQLNISFNEKLDIFSESQKQLNISFNEKLDIFSESQKQMNISFNEKLEVLSQANKETNEKLENIVNDSKNTTDILETLRGNITEIFNFAINIYDVLRGDIIRVKDVIGKGFNDTGNSVDNLGAFIETAFTYQHDYSSNRAAALKKVTSPVEFVAGKLTKFAFRYGDYVGELTDSHTPCDYDEANNSTRDKAGILWRAVNDTDLAVSSACPTTDYVIDLNLMGNLSVGDVQSTFGYTLGDNDTSQEVFYTGELSFKNHSYSSDTNCIKPFSGCALGVNNVVVIIGNQISGMSGSPVADRNGISGITSATINIERDFMFKSNITNICNNKSDETCVNNAREMNVVLNAAFSDLLRLKNYVRSHFATVTPSVAIKEGIESLINLGHLKRFDDCLKIKKFTVLTLPKFPKLKDVVKEI